MSDPVTGAMRLLQFGDSMLPVGSFTFSNGLEAAVQQRVVFDATTLRTFVETALVQAGSSDGVALLAAHRAAIARDLAALMRADQAVLLRKSNEEMRTMTLRMGRKLAELGARVAPCPLVLDWSAAIASRTTPGTFPVSLGALFACQGMDPPQAFAAHQYGVATMMLGSALRLLKLDYLDAQSILHGVNAGAEAAYARAAACALEDMATFSPQADILAAVHVKAHVRMFMN